MTHNLEPNLIIRTNFSVFHVAIYGILPQSCLLSKGSQPSKQDTIRLTLPLTAIYLRHRPQNHHLNTALQPLKHVLLYLSRPVQIDIRLARFPQKLEPHIRSTPHILRNAFRNNTVQPIVADPLCRALVPLASCGAQHTNRTAVKAGALQSSCGMGQDGIGRILVLVAVAAGVVERDSVVFV